jgi:hypothetical protein
MRFFENWWEFLGTANRVLPFVVVAVVTLILRPAGYYWE